MKKNLVFILVLISINGFTQFNQIDTLNVNRKIRKEVLEFTINTINVCDGGKYIQLNKNTAELRLLNNYSSLKLKESCKWIKERYGKVEKIKLEQIQIDKNKNLVFRYKVYRDKSDVVQEVRTFLSYRNKYYGLVHKIYWSDKFYQGKEHPQLFINSLDKISLSRKEVLEKFAFDSYNICKRDKLPPITKENTEYRSFRKDWVSEMLLECDSIKQKNGEIKSLKLVQYLSDDVYSKVYRFRVKFEKLSKPSEIRIYANIKNKYRGIFVVDRWYSNYLEFREAIAKSEIDLNNQSN